MICFLLLSNGVCSKRHKFKVRHTASRRLAYPIHRNNSTTYDKDPWQEITSIDNGLK